MSVSVDVYDRKLAAAHDLIKQHNERVSNKLDWDAIKAKLQEMGATNDETLREMSWEDLQESGVPRLLARHIANQIFRPDHTTAAADKPLLKPSHVRNMTRTQLFELYDINGDTNTLITERLLELSCGKRCVVVDNDNKVQVAASAELLYEISPSQNFPEKSSYVANGKLYRVLKVGEVPNLVFDENPLYPGERLRSGKCDHTNFDWTGIALGIRQLVYLAIKRGDIKINSIDDAHRIVDLIKDGDVFDKLQSRYVEAAIQLQDLIKSGNAPRLTISGSTSPGKPHGKPQDPFYGHKRY